ncbi:hypothetical protein RYX56_06490 [Alkalihalophilus lindianensis]|uniref:YvrJ protein family protein n=1 Tax=Alkalihalophilus lindianensis TaxID=1630542 RepID=A0ABU3X7Z9_9BACI|nr:hypothetical protein [Alkalihalophilus lindianensis]MDV2684019.1 hypothetical protein [Alkalihalophilus lindianensis]
MGIGIGTFLYLIPIILVALVIRWIRLIMLNSDEQVKQNIEIITLLREIKEKKD